MNAPVKVCCRLCLFFVFDPKSSESALAGMCRKYPPKCQIVTRINPLNRSVTEMTTAVILPVVNGEKDWCGEFQEAPPFVDLSCPPDPIAGCEEDRQVSGGKVKA